MSVWAQLNRQTCCVVFDTETNGLFRDGSTNPRMVALAWSVFSIEKGSFKKRSFIVRADDFDPNPSGSLKHGIDKAKALREGVQVLPILEELKRDLNSFQPKLLVAHNIEFDIQVLQSECRLIGFDLSQELALPKFCTMRQTTSVLRIQNPEHQRRIAAFIRDHDMRTDRAKRGLAFYERILSKKLNYKFPKLRELHEHLFGIPNENWHDALADVEACERCFRKIAEQKIIEHAAWLTRKAQREAERQEREKRENEWRGRKRMLINELDQIQSKAHKTVFNFPNYIFFFVIIVLTVFLPPIGIFVGVCAFFGIRGDYKRAREAFHQMQQSIVQEEQKHLK